MVYCLVSELVVSMCDLALASVKLTCCRDVDSCQTPGLSVYEDCHCVFAKSVGI